MLHIHWLWLDNATTYHKIPQHIMCVQTMSLSQSVFPSCTIQLISGSLCTKFSYYLLFFLLTNTTRPLSRLKRNSQDCCGSLAACAVDIIALLSSYSMQFDVNVCVCSSTKYSQLFRSVGQFWCSEVTVSNRRSFKRFILMLFLIL